MTWGAALRLGPSHRKGAPRTSALTPALRARLRGVGVEVTAVTSLTRAAAWYHRREVWKGSTLPGLPRDPVRWLATEHAGKLRRWFTTATWVRGYLRSADALGRLVALDSPWTRAEGLVVAPEARTVEGVVHAADAMGYFETLHPGRERHHWYRALFQAGALRPVADHALLLRTIEADEVAPPGERLYLHDGIGRAVPYLWLVRHHLVRFRPVEVWVAVEAR